MNLTKFQNYLKDLQRIIKTLPTEVKQNKERRGRRGMDLARFDIHKKHLRHLNFHVVFLKSCCLKIVLMSSGGCDHHQNVGGEENEHSQALLLKISTAFQAVSLDLPKLGVDITKVTFEECCCVTMDTDGVLSSLQERLELLNPDIRQLYDLISSNSSPTFVNGLSHETVKENINLLIKHIENLEMHKLEEVAPLNKDLESTRKSLLFLSNFLGFTSKRSSKQLGKLTDLVNHAEFMVRNIYCLLYLCPVRINDPMVMNDWKMQFSAELLNFSPEQAATREVYIKALEVSKSSLGDSNAAVDGFDFQFLQSLEDSILELSDNNLSFIATNKDHILSLHKELQILTFCFAMSKSDPSEFGPRSAQLDHLIHFSNYFQMHISAIIIDMGCLIYALYSNEKNINREANELKVAFTTLQDTMKTARENAKKTYEPYIPKSWWMKTKFRNTDAKGEIISLKRIWEKSNSYEKEMNYMTCYCFSNYVFSAFQEEIQSLIGTFRNLIAKQHFEAEELQIINVDDIRSKTLYLFSSNPLNVRSNNFMLFLLIEDIKKIKREFEDLQSQITQESKVNSINTYVNVGVGGIEDHESNLDLLCRKKDEVEAHRLKEAFLEVFLRCKGKKHTEAEELRVLTSICSGSSSTDQEFRRLFSDSNIRISPQIGISDDDDEAVMESLKALLQNIEVLLKCDNELVDPLKKELEAAQKSLRYLRNFIGFTSKSCGEPQKLKDLIFHTELLVCKISFLLYLCCDVEKMSNYEVVNEIKMHLSSELQKFSPALPDVRDIYIKSLKASKSAKATSDSAKLNEYVLGFLDSLREDALKLFNNNLSHTAKDRVLSLQEELKFLITFFTADKSLEGQSENKHISNFVFECIKAVVIDIGCVIYSLNDDMNDEMMARQLSEKVSFWEENFMAAKARIREIYELDVPRPLWSDFPRTNGKGFVNTLLWSLNELSSTKDGLVAPLKKNIEIVKEELLALREYFVETGKSSCHSEELQSQWSYFLDTAYQTEYVIDSFLAGDCHLYRYKLGLFNVIEDIKRIKTEIKATEIKKTDETSVHKSSCFPAQILVEEPDLPKQNVVISSKERQADEKSTTQHMIFEEEAKSIREKLTNGSGKLNIISIVGMGGIGKTTLADSVFQHSSVTDHFHVKAKCTVSQVHDRRRLLLEILKQINIPCSEHDDELDRKLYQSLKGRRYLILMDDVWDIQPWEDLRASFPDESNGSRIIFTSRSHDTAAQTGLETNVYELVPISEKESWRMLQVKLFGSQSCPTELDSIGREIAASCRGLPLTIDLVAGVLRGKGREEWKNVAECLKAILFKDPEGRCQEVLELSYKNLPDDMKPCFLYFAAFPEDSNVSTKTLISLWIAEGFVQLENCGESRRLEDVANDILKKLINRSLVTVYRETALGEVTATRVHDLLHEFAVAKAKEEKFMLRIDGTDVTHVGIHRDQQQDPYRLCIFPGNLESFLRSNPSGPRTRSLVCHYAPFANNNNFSLNLRAFKLLRVLYIPYANSCRYHPEMFRLTHLRVLVIGESSSSDDSLIMSKIHKFRNLECFMMSGVPGRRSVHLLLDKICKMERLRSFCFGGYISFKYRSEKIWEMSSLFNNLHTLSHLKVSYVEDIEKILKLMPNLLNLDATFYSPYEGDHLFPKLGFLDKLEFLKVRHERASGYTTRHERPSGFTTRMMDEICFPQYLKKLVLSNFRFPWTEIWKLGNLEFLETLKLKDAAFKGPIWDMIDGQFPNLKYLNLFKLDIQEWNASRDHLRCLQLLLVSDCKKLEELPPCLAEIETLQGMKIDDCNGSVEISAMRIKQEQDETRDEQIYFEIIQREGSDDSEDNDDDDEQEDDDDDENSEEE